ncbi:hypothetical protein VB735_13350 [Halotia wernerae UHCC 0503]|nr:hypothetical protein [Halotia wernerae UHCC 0503]
MSKLWSNLVAEELLGGRGKILSVAEVIEELYGKIDAEDVMEVKPKVLNEDHEGKSIANYLLTISQGVYLLMNVSKKVSVKKILLHLVRLNGLNVAFAVNAEVTYFIN